MPCSHAGHRDIVEYKHKRNSERVEPPGGVQFTALIRNPAMLASVIKILWRKLSHMYGSLIREKGAFCGCPTTGSRRSRLHDVRQRRGGALVRRTGLHGSSWPALGCPAPCL